ncbi:MAG: FAD-dependent oxidoreductase [Clostridiales bacterium]|nr:FAD-dependent oxidoreductase [Clostridiales bacterium]
MIISESKVLHQTDICVIGGGLSGLIAAVAAARHGAKVVLMHDRPVLGGNASSEIRMWVRGAAGVENRETGIIQEIELENIYRNPTMNYSIWDTVLYQIVRNEENIQLLLNCTCVGCDMKDGKIESITGWQLNSYTWHRVEADIFMDCSGDSILAPLTGADFRVGREARDEYDEYAAPEVADSYTMGSSCLIEARKTDHPCKFIPPEWANVYPDDESMYLKNHDIIGTDVNFWWIELGGEEDTILDAQSINEELIKVAYGVWDHIKNHGDHGMENWELEWVGFLPGKRESRRYVGPYVLNQRDLEEGHHFEDAVAFGGWTMDNHNPKGFKFMGYSSHHIKPKVPYEIPFRCMYSRNVPNLMFAGRNISATHMAMSSTRVMATCSVIGQAAGTGAALAVKYGCMPSKVSEEHIAELQAMLLEDGCFIPGLNRAVSGKVQAELNEAEKRILENGWERPNDGNANTIAVPDGGSLVIDILGPCKKLRLALDTDFSRESITNCSKYKKFAMRTHVDPERDHVSMPANLLKGAKVAFKTTIGEIECAEIADNRKACIYIDVPEGAVRAEITGICSWGGSEARFFGVDASE